jgi:WxL domain surface cell wall-binding
LLSSAGRSVGLLVFAMLTITSPASAGFTVTSTATPSFSLTLTGANQTGGYAMPLTVDNSGVGSSATGWNLTVSSTQFATGGGPMLSANASTITAVSTACASICVTNPTNSLTYPLVLPVGSAAKFFNASSTTGIGTFTITPSVSVAVPANAYAGSYTSTLTVSLVSGP